jgi:hypothetical protein
LTLTVRLKGEHDGGCQSRGDGPARQETIRERIWEMAYGHLKEPMKELQAIIPSDMTSWSHPHRPKNEMAWTCWKTPLEAMMVDEG